MNQPHNIETFYRVFQDISALVHSKTRIEEELDFIVSIAEQCACAINKARLLEETRTQYDQLALQTENISQKIHNFLSKCRTKVYQPITIYAAKELL